MKKLLIVLLVSGLLVLVYIGMRGGESHEAEPAPGANSVATPQETEVPTPVPVPVTDSPAAVTPSAEVPQAESASAFSNTSPLERLKNALEQEDPCELARVGLGSELDPVQAAQVLLETSGASRTLAPEEMEMMEGLFKPHCTMAEGDQNPTALAYRAYCLAAHPEGEKDIPAQIRMLWNRLRRLEPRNGAHLFVWASYLLKRERAKGDAEPRGLLAQAMQLERFDLKRRGMVERIRELASRNSAMALLGEQLVLLVPQPDLATATEYWSEALKKTPLPDVRHSLSWAQRSARRNWRRAQNGLEGIDWSIQEFESARKIGISAWKRLRGPAVPLPEEFLREPMDLIKRNPVELSKATAMTALRGESCDRSAWDRVHEEQQRLLRRR